MLGVARIGQFRRMGDARGIGQPGTDSLAQLLGGGAGERHHQYVAYRGAFLDDQAQIEPGQRKRLAGAGAGLDQAQAG